LLGSFLSSSVSRENVVLKAKFMRQDLPYFLEAFADVLKNTKYQCMQPPKSKNRRDEAEDEEEEKKKEQEKLRERRDAD
jgi:hypothetical protein